LTVAIGLILKQRLGKSKLFVFSESHPHLLLACAGHCFNNKGRQKFGNRVKQELKQTFK